jgi:glycosyltransferase involved in cell wall biosynthesis
MSIKVLFVCSGNYGEISPFIKDQEEVLVKAGIRIDYFLIKGKGIFGYLKNLKDLKYKIKKEGYDIIHAHYGLSGLLSNLQRRVPVITTFHGSDINIKKNRKFSKVANYLSSHSIFVSNDLKDILNVSKQYTIIPCGVDTNLFKPTSNCDTQNIDKNIIKIVFSSSFNRTVKNAQLAIKAVDKVKNDMGKSIKLIELKGYTRKEVAKLINDSDVCLLTSFSEGSPQFIKEAMACNRPIVSTNVGDVNRLFGEKKGHFITSFDLDDVSTKLKQAIEYSMTFKNTRGRDQLINMGLESKAIANRLIEIYKRSIE